MSGHRISRNGRKLLPYFKEFLRDLYDQGLSRKTFVLYRDNLWLLGGTIISNVSSCEKYQEYPLHKLMGAVECDGILPDHYERRSCGFSKECAAASKSIFGENTESVRAVQFPIGFAPLDLILDHTNSTGVL